ncbi:hypothetical protein [Streptomyces ureilyticus]|uniref:Uncharacterized protein n=1 Tax=Streptomyces ureilyticus TaxID=1775131 RepID=A0ABX0E460_9ACTN|nr:hypothetical protein [Streptomyces ureilyticus]NGO47348.1 hypothetical protein [Streptomyces ureilyticus]
MVRSPGSAPAAMRQCVEDWGIESIQRNILRSAADCRSEGLEFVLELEDAVRWTP